MYTYWLRAWACVGSTNGAGRPPAKELHELEKNKMEMKKSAVLNE